MSSIKDQIAALRSAHTNGLLTADEFTAAITRLVTEQPPQDQREEVREEARPPPSSRPHDASYVYAAPPAIPLPRAPAAVATSRNDAILLPRRFSDTPQRSASTAHVIDVLRSRAANAKRLREEEEEATKENVSSDEGDGGDKSEAGSEGVENAVHVNPLLPFAREMSLGIITQKSLPAPDAAAVALLQQQVAGAPEQRWCNLCNTLVSGTENWAIHIGGQQHQAKERMGGMTDQFVCNVCNMSISGEDQVVAHLKGKKHTRKFSMWREQQRFAQRITIEREALSLPLH